MSEATEKLDKATEELLVMDAKLRTAIIRSGEEIAKKYGYPGLDGMDAVCRYLADKYHWFPSQVRALSTDDLLIVLEGA